MNYPKECFSANIHTTQLARKAYEQAQDRMYTWIETNYPDYYKLDLRERMKIRDEYKKLH